MYGPLRTPVYPLEWEDLACGRRRICIGITAVVVGRLGLRGGPV